MSPVTGFICRVRPYVISDRFYLQFYLQGQARCSLQQVLFAGSSQVSSMIGFICRVKPDVISDRFYLQGETVGTPDVISDGLPGCE